MDNNGRSTVTFLFYHTMERRVDNTNTILLLFHSYRRFHINKMKQNIVLSLSHSLFSEIFFFVPAVKTCNLFPNGKYILHKIEKDISVISEEPRKPQSRKVYNSQLEEFPMMNCWEADIR